MEIRKFNCFNDMVEYLLKYKSEEDSVSVIAHYKYIGQLFTKLVKANVPLGNVHISTPEFDNYQREYILTISDNSLWVEPMWRESNQWNDAGYIDDESDVCFVHQDCNSQVLKHIDTDEIYEFSVKNLDNDCEEVADTTVGLYDGTDGFTFSISEDNCYVGYSFYSSVPDMVKDAKERVLRLYGV